jgi:diguanylate cyclase (GGDEF)-like protein
MKKGDPSGKGGGGARRSRAGSGSQDDLALAIAATRDAYRDTTRLIRLLSVLGQPAGPEQLVDQTLTVLSEVFFTEIVAVAHQAGARLLVTSWCGLAEDDPVIREGWPIGGAAVEALGSGEVVTRAGCLDGELPASAVPLGIRSGAWVPLSTQPGSDNLMILLRRSAAVFTLSDQHVLRSVAARLRLATEERERTIVIEQLARDGHLLARHLELDPLLDEAVAMLRQLTGADQAWVVTFDSDQAQLRAHRGLSEQDRADWPRPAGELDGWRPAAMADSATEDASVLRVPVWHDGALAAILFSARARRRPFARGAAELTTVFANHLAAAMVNAELYRTLRHRATQDPLTGLANRVLVGQHLDRALDPPGAARVGVLFCDLDRFKAVNDLLGHEAGDELLQQVAQRLRGSVRPGDLLARFGGDEFVVVLDAVRDLAEVADVGRRVGQALDGPFLLRGERVRVTVSVGGVLGVPGQTTASAMLRDADAAMYAAKERGLGLVEVFDEAASHRALDRLDLRSELAHALDRGQLEVYYQPIEALDTGQVVAFEALLRWHHPRHGTVPPEVFIPLAEDTGAMVPIGDWVLDQACRQLAAWRALCSGGDRARAAAGGDGQLAISVNLSATQLRTTRAADRLLAGIRGAGVQPADVWLEVTESSYLSADVSICADALSAAGVHFALDDFGTAYSSLSYLQRFPIEVLKIDPSFVAGMTRRERDRGIVRAILAIAQSLDLTAVGEGIETERQRVALRVLGCQLGQGHLMSPAVPAAEATRYLRASMATPPVPAG